MSWGVPHPRVSLRALLLVTAAATLLLALAPAALAVPSPASWGVDATGGGDKVPATIPNDYTAAGLQFAVGTPLAANTNYYVKVAFCQGAYSAATARGVLWNATSGKWVRTGGAWSDFPVIQTNATATGVASGSTWAYAAFGDDTQSGTWTVYFIARPVSGTDADAVVGTATTTLTVIDMKTAGAWVHNGVSIYTGGLTRAEVDATSTIGASHGNTLALFQTEDNGCADGNDTIIPPAGFTGGFRLWTPVPNPGYNATNVGGDYYVALNRKTLTAVTTTGYTGATHFAVPPADTDVAAGAADMTPPIAPASLTALGGQASIKLSWPAATDNIAVTAYRVYRWAAPPEGATYSSKHELIATVTPAGDGTGSYTDADTALVSGTFYSYEVRAVDAASNIGPRSATAHALFGDVPPVTVATGLASSHTSGWTNAASPTFSLSATDTDATHVATTWYTVNGGADLQWTANPVAPAGLHEGTNTITYWSVDTGDLKETPHTGYINIGRTAPVTTVAGVPSGWARHPVDLTFSAQAGAAPVAYTEYRVGGGSWTKGSSLTVSRQGETTVEYRSADEAGNVEATQSCVVSIDSAAPKVNAYGPTTVWQGGNARFAFRVSDASGGPVTVKIGITSYGRQIASYDVGAKQVGRKVVGIARCTLPVGSYSWRVVVRDAAGNSARTAAQVLKVLPGAHNRQ